MGQHFKPVAVNDFSSDLGSILVRVIYGSHLFGVATESSDTDYLTIFQTSALRLLRQKYNPSYERATNPEARNTKDDIDSKYYDLQFFIKSCLGGQTFALDLLHAPKDKIVISTDTWEEILSLKDKLVTNNVLPFVGYCRGQADKYSAKGEKYNNLVTVLERAANPELANAKFVRDYADAGMFANLTQFSVETRRGVDTNELYLYGPNCAFPLNRRLDEVMPIIQARFNDYGSRTKEAAKADGLDLKAYYHALRVVWQMEEYLTTGKLTFPHPRASELLRVRRGEWSRPYIEAWIDEELLRVRALPNNLPTPDHAFWDEWLDHKVYELAKREMHLA